ncbi:hypothetical protein G6L94_14525 [Agrobacterium rhizogenes]|nr:hypothetical protein [Rhizobium rhizogenes]
MAVAQPDAGFAHLGGMLSWMVVLDDTGSRAMCTLVSLTLGRFQSCRIS